MSAPRAGCVPMTPEEINDAYFAATGFEHGDIAGAFDSGVKCAEAHHRIGATFEPGREPLRHLVDRAARADVINVFGIPLDRMTREELIGVVHMQFEDARSAQSSRQLLYDLLARRNA